VRPSTAKAIFISSRAPATRRQDQAAQNRTVPGVDPITALTWALEMGDVARFYTPKQGISYCCPCGDERSSADKVMRMRCRSSDTLGDHVKSGHT
jgi:transposase